MHRTHETRGRRFGVLLTVTLLAVGLAACDPDSETGAGAVPTADGVPPATSDGPSDDERRLEFTRCMREQGVEVEDSSPGEMTSEGDGDVSGSEMSIPEGVDLSKAEEACSHLAPAGEQATAPTAEEIAVLRKYAACLRANGVDVPDPDPQTGVLELLGDGSDSGSLAAYEACDHHFDTDDDR